MRIGFLTNALANGGVRQLEDIAAWAVENGFQDLEVGPSIPLEEEVFSRVLGGGEVDITALIYCRNYLSTDPEEAALHRAELEKRIRFAGKMGIEKVVTSTGIDKSVEENVYDRADAIRKIPARSMGKVVEVFTPLLDLAEKCDVKIAFENCPLMGNIAISPVLWAELFQHLDSPRVGLAYDPSHLLWQMIDPYAPLDEFADRIFHVHAKDTTIDRPRLARTGILTDFSWWRYRIPGDGELDWGHFMAQLKKAGYDGTVSIEHEDVGYEGSLERVQQGLVAGRGYLEDVMKMEEG